LQLNHVENYQNRTNNLDPMNYYQNSYYYEKNADNSIAYSGYHNLRPYPSYFDSLFREEKKLTLDDNLKIQKTLKNLENYLENIYPSDYIVRVIAWLRYSCRTDRSEEPLKKFLLQNHLGYLWQF
jgi:hypothetical protein